MPSSEKNSASSHNWDSGASRSPDNSSSSAYHFCQGTVGRTSVMWSQGFLPAALWSRTYYTPHFIEKGRAQGSDVICWVTPSPRVQNWALKTSWFSSTTRVLLNSSLNKTTWITYYKMLHVLLCIFSYLHTKFLFTHSQLILFWKERFGKYDEVFRLLTCYVLWADGNHFSFEMALERMSVQPGERNIFLPSLIMFINSAPILPNL